MNTETQETSHAVTARLTLDVTYLLNGEAAPEMLARLRAMCERAIGEGLLTGDTNAEVDTYAVSVVMLDSEAFAPEATAADAGDQDLARVTAMPIAVACRNASGMADMPVFTVFPSQAELELGLAYDQAEALAQEAGYEGPFVCFDPAEQRAIASAALELKATPCEPRMTKPSAPRRVSR